MPNKTQQLKGTSTVINKNFKSNHAVQVYMQRVIKNTKKELATLEREITELEQAQ